MHQSVAKMNFKVIYLIALWFIEFRPTLAGEKRAYEIVEVEEDETILITNFDLIPVLKLYISFTIPTSSKAYIVSNLFLSKLSLGLNLLTVIESSFNGGTMRRDVRALCRSRYRIYISTRHIL